MKKTNTKFTKSGDKAKKVEKTNTRFTKRGVATKKDSCEVQYRITFLIDQQFRGHFYKQGETKMAQEWEFNAYKTRTNLLKFDKI